MESEADKEIERQAEMLQKNGEVKKRKPQITRKQTKFDSIEYSQEQQTKNANQIKESALDSDAKKEDS